MKCRHCDSEINFSKIEHISEDDSHVFIGVECDGCGQVYETCIAISELECDLD